MTEKSKYRGTKLYHLVFSELITAARYRGTVTYQEIAKIMGLPLSGNYMGREIGEIIGEISEDEVKQGRPMLSAIVVGVNGKPGAGFFIWAKELYGVSDDDEFDEETFWKEECSKVYETWKVDLTEK